MLGPSKHFVIVYLCIFILAQVFAWGGSGGRAAGGGIRGLGNKTGNPQRSPYIGLGVANGDSSYNQPSAAARQARPEANRSRGLGISAWGLIGIILTVILGGISLYYIFLFYPILCKKERNYDIMELTTV